MANSATVTSRGVPKVAMMLKKRSSPSLLAQPQRDEDVARPGELHFGLGLVAQVGADLLVQGGEFRVAGEGDLAAQAGEQVGAPFAVVDDARGQALRVEEARSTLAVRSGSMPSASRPRPALASTRFQRWSTTTAG